MRGKKSKGNQEKVYGDHSHRAREYTKETGRKYRLPTSNKFVEITGTIRNIGKRAEYLKTKKEYKNKWK